MKIELTPFQKLQQRLIREENLPLAYTAVLAADAMYRFAPEAKQAALRWAEGESIADFQMLGKTVKSIQSAVDGSEFLALCILNTCDTRFDAFREATLRMQVIEDAGAAAVTEEELKEAIRKLRSERNRG